MDHFQSQIQDHCFGAADDNENVVDSVDLWEMAKTKRVKVSWIERKK